MVVVVPRLPLASPVKEAVTFPVEESEACVSGQVPGLSCTKTPVKEPGQVAGPGKNHG